MKRIIPIICLLVLLAGCSGQGETLDRAMNLRAKLLGAQGISFDAEITADYGDKLYTFSMACRADAQGSLSFTVLAPEVIAGVTGTVSQGSGKLTFGDQALAFDLMADGLVSPVSGPWVLLRTLRGGYLTACGEEESLLRVTLDDSYAEDALHVDVWLNAQDVPVRGEILWQGRRILSLEVKNFEIL